jgi:hypothetical protein
LVSWSTKGNLKVQTGASQADLKLIFLDGKKMNKGKHKTYQAAPRTESPTESAMPIAENTNGDM